MKKLFMITTIFGALNLALFATPYTLDMAKSKVGFEISHLKLTKVEGNFSKFSGNIDYENNAIKALDGTIDVASVDTSNQKRDDHLRAPDIFDVAKFPNMTFKMTKFENGKMYGKLTIKDTTKEVILDSQSKLNGKTLEINANTTIKRSDFGVVWESSLKDSLVGDEVKLILTLVANQ